MYVEQTFESHRGSLVTASEAGDLAAGEWQASLFAAGDPGFDPDLAGLQRTWLDATSWVDHLPRWLDGSDEVFAELVARLPWRQRTVPMYDRLVREPRLTWWWAEGEQGGTSPPLPILDDARRALSRWYGRWFDSVGFNYYRTGADSVAWHGDRIRFSQEDPIVAIVSVGAPRAFLLRPRGGGHSLSFLLGEGDLMVMGGASQHDWEHTVPKVATAGPRISVTYRHDTAAPAESVAAHGSRPPSVRAHNRHTPATAPPHTAGRLQVGGAEERGARPGTVGRQTEGPPT